MSKKKSTSSLISELKRKTRINYSSEEKIRIIVEGSMANIEEDTRKESQVTGELVSQIGDAYGDLEDAAASYAITALKQANSRMKATKAGRDFMFIMSKKDKDIVLLKVSKITGKIEGEIALGKDREPNYAVDDITGQVFYLLGDNELTSYQVN